MQMQAKEAQRAFHWRLWHRVFGYPLMPPKELLDQDVLALFALGQRLWREEARPWLEPDFPRLFAESPGAAELTTSVEYGRVGAAGYRIAQALYRLHGDDAIVEHRVGTTAMWLAMAAAALDHLLDTGIASAGELARWVNSALVEAALPEDPGQVPHHFTWQGQRPELWFLLQLLERSFAGIRSCLDSGGAPAEGRLREEILACLRRMVESELRSPLLRLRAGAPLDQVEGELRVVNTLCVWITAYLGLLGKPLPAREVLDALLRVTTLLGEVGWALDALSDIHQDLDEGVFSLVWLTLLREGGPEGPRWLRDLPGSAEEALADLECGPTLDRLLSRIAVAIREIEGEPALPPPGREALGRLCRMMVWCFLVPQSPPPEGAW